MRDGELAYRFELQLDSSPEQLWPLVSDTNRFNRDAGVPAVEELGVGDNARRRLQLTRLGVGVEWEEEPFEWVSPHRFSVVRRYTRGPVAAMRTRATLEPLEGGGTKLVYEVRVRPRGVLGRPAAALQVGMISRRRFVSVFRAYDRAARTQATAVPTPKPRLAAGAAARIEAAPDRRCSAPGSSMTTSIGSARSSRTATSWRSRPSARTRSRTRGVGTGARCSSSASKRRGTGCSSCAGS